MVDGVNLSPCYIIPLANYHNYQTISFVYILFLIGVIETVPLLSSPSQLTGPKPPCARKCTKKGPPVCGSNGRTYRNKCRFLVAQCLARKKGIVLTFKKGRCKGNRDWWPVIEIQTPMIMFWKVPHALQGLHHSFTTIVITFLHLSFCLSLSVIQSLSVSSLSAPQLKAYSTVLISNLFSLFPMFSY